MSEHNIYTALAAAQKNMGKAVKGSVNPHFKSKYADLADVMQVALPALSEQGIAAWHSVTILEGTQCMRTTLSHGASDTHISCDVPLIVNKGDMQGMKSATTYAKRIGIESVTGIAPEDDDGNAAASAPPSAKRINADQADAIRQLIKETGTNEAKFLEWAKCGSVEEMDASKYASAVDLMESKRGK